MSDDGKEAPAPGLGFNTLQAKKYRMERLARPSHWSPGVRVKSAEEYDRYADHLARELLATCTPEHMAVIAAQHMIYSDELKCLLEEDKADLDKVFKSFFEITVQTSTMTAMTAVEAYRKHSAEKRAAGVRARKEDVMALAREIAAEKWRKDIGKKIKIGKMAETVFSDLKKTKYCKLVSSVGAVRRWIKPEAPDFASQPGPG
ncbi:MAG: hypothetical protein ACKVLM_04750 [Pseudomonadales bacterium]|uniref:hypothetical protein n=1 Tax=Stutzerimonas xanthomarina TaxID=271420 RepID=UPI0029BC61BD|nr:hypothetical protein [Stutzerimonas xanthomarina]MDX2355000.1 hypothetical protein [Stutzerimonas xanthomarina]